MTRPTTSELYSLSGFTAGEVEKSRHLRGRICDGTATPEDHLAYQPFAAKWNRYAELLAERDQADAIEQRAPSPGRHDADPDASLGAALRQHRDNQPGPRTVIRTRLVQVDMGEGGLQNIPEAQPLPQYRGSADASGHRIIAAGLNSADKKR
jgi:hypothetical protein